MIRMTLIISFVCGVLAAIGVKQLGNPLGASIVTGYMIMGLVYVDMFMWHYFRRSKPYDKIKKFIMGRSKLA